jgi:hypothetical protein
MQIIYTLAISYATAANTSFPRVPALLLLHEAAQPRSDNCLRTGGATGG